MKRTDTTIAHSPQSGMTLIELLVVCVLLSLMAAILYGTINGILRSKLFLDGRTLDDRKAEYVLSRMIRELSSHVSYALNPLRPSSRENSRGGRGGGVSNLFLLGVNKDGEFGQMDSIRFVSSGVSQEFFGAFANNGPVDIEYRLEKPSSAEGKPEIADNRFVLVREEVPVMVGNRDILKERRVLFPLIDDVGSLGFRYMTRGKWVDKWQKPRSVPEVVEITISLYDKNGTEKTYKTSVGLARALR